MASTTISSISILGVHVHTLSYDAVIKHCRKILQEPASKPYLIMTPNPEIVVHAQSHPNYRTVLNQADLALPDGVGLVLASGGRIPQRVTGVDVVEIILEDCARLHKKVGIVQRIDGLATPEQLQTGLQQRFPGLDCVVTTTGFTDVPDVIIVTLGCPQQEQWLVDNRTHYPNTQLMLAVGGAIDFIVGIQNRAPSIFRSIGLEWLWRLVLQPQRWRRIITAVVIFPWFILRALIVKHSIA